jgi:hypothetical protein
MWRIVGMVVIGVLACAERPNFNQNEIGDVCEVPADCGVDDSTMADWTDIAQGDYALAPITFSTTSIGCVEQQCCLSPSEFEPVSDEYLALTYPYMSGAPLSAGSNGVHYMCERDADCCAGSQCAHVFESDGYPFEYIECRQMCDSSSECPSDRCEDGVCVEPDETVVQASHP